MQLGGRLFRKWRERNERRQAAFDKEVARLVEDPELFHVRRQYTLICCILFAVFFLTGVICVCAALLLVHFETREAIINTPTFRENPRMLLYVIGGFLAAFVLGAIYASISLLSSIHGSRQVLQKANHERRAKINLNP